MGATLSSLEVTTKLHEAAGKGDLEEVKKHIKKGGNPNKPLTNNEFQKPQILKPKVEPKVIEKEKSETFNKLVDALAEDELANSVISTTTTLENDQTPQSKSLKLKMNALHRAATRKNNLKVLQFILTQISDVDDPDSEGDSALHYTTMFHNNVESVKLIMASEPSVNLQNDHGDTALYSAVTFGRDLRIVELLLKSGANPNICNIDGQTPLHACAMRRGIDPLIPGILLRFGANPNLKNKNGQTTLHAAAEATNNAVLLLLKFNAKVRLRDNNGHRPSEVASSEEIRKVLQEEENDLLERTTRMSDIIEADNAQLFTTSPRKSYAVQSWLNGQNSIDSASEYERNGSVRGSVREERSRGSEIIYPRRSIFSENGTAVSSRLNEDVYKRFGGGGGEGVIELPNNKEVVMPPDAVPMGTKLKVTIRENGLKQSNVDLADFDFHFDLKIQLPGKSLLLPWSQSQQHQIKAPPAFSGMVWEGDNSWQCVRELTDDPGSDITVRFSMKKEKCVPMDRRASQVNFVIPVTKEKKDEKDEETSSSYSDEDSEVGNIEPGKHDLIDGSTDSLLTEKFWARQVVVVKEASDTSGSCDGSEADSYAEDEPRRHDDFDEDVLVDINDNQEILDESLRIQHPIDQELATITEEDGNLHDNDEGNLVKNSHNDCNDHSLIKESTLSLDSGYRESIDLED